MAKYGKNNIENNNDAINKEREPCKLFCLNLQGLINEYTKRNKQKYKKWKIDAIKDYVNSNNVILMNFTETWLKNKIQDVKLPDFTTYRCDRKSKKSKGGGTAIYLKKGYEAKLILEDRVEDCEMVAIHIEKINVINIVIYRPPDTKSATFTMVMDKVKKLLSQMEAPEPTVIISGDFNFRFIKWTRGELNGCRWSMKTYSQAKLDEQRQFYKMMEVMDNFHLSQTIQEPTRKENTLDLVFTNNISIFTQIDVSKTILSDHDLIELSTNLPDENKNMKITDAEIKREEEDLRTLNFHHENVSWSLINEILEEMPWGRWFEGKSNEQCTEIFIRCVREICFNLIPKKNCKRKNKIPRARKNMLNRIKMLKRKKNGTRDKSKIKRIENSIIETEIRLAEHRKQEKT